MILGVISMTMRVVHHGDLTDCEVIYMTTHGPIPTITDRYGCKVGGDGLLYHFPQ